MEEDLKNEVEYLKDEIKSKDEEIAELKDRIHDMISDLKTVYDITRHY